MDIAGRKTKDISLYIAVLSLLIIGLALIFSTWQMLRAQEKASNAHLSLTARAVLQAVESSLRRGSMAQGHLSPNTREFFQELQDNDDLLFVSFINAQGQSLFAGKDEAGSKPLLSKEALQELRETGRWEGPVTLQAPAGTGQRNQRHQYAYVAARLRDSPRSPGGHMGHMMPSFPARPDEPQDVFLIVAMDMEKYLAINTGFRHTAVFQVAYTLAAALFLLFFARHFFSRRELAGKALFLERFQTSLLDALPDGLMTVDGRGRIRAANPAAQQLLDPAGPPLAGRSIDAVVPGQALKGVSREELTRRELAFGNALCEITSLPFEAEEPFLMVLIRDRTHIRRLEQSLAEAEKLAAIGTLAAGVAHEIRNPLSSLRGFAQYFAKKLAGKKPEEEYAETMVREADRLNRVITDLLYLARPRKLMFSTIALHPLLDELESLLRFELKEKKLELRRDLRVESLIADRENVKQALLNLLLNALEAQAAANGNSGIREGTPESCIVIRSAPAADGSGDVIITVEDSGPGMSREQQKQAFEAFYTTKAKGTGLGLALVQKTMSEHGGRASLETAPGQGCAVRLAFPAAAATPDEGSENEDHPGY